MASANPDSVAGQGEFKPTVPRDEPLTTKGHQPGRLVSENDHAPEFSAQTLPPGSAPPEYTFQPNPESEVPGQANNPDTLRAHGKESTYTDALDTLGGATSGDVNTGFGHPGQGQTSTEIRHEGKHTATRDQAGVELRGATGGSGLHDDGNRMKSDLESDKLGKGPITGHNVSRVGAEDQLPTRAEEVAAERK